LTGGLAAVGTGMLVAGTDGVARAAEAAAPSVGTLPGGVTIVLRGVDWRMTVPVPPVAGSGVPRPAPSGLRAIGRLVDSSGADAGSFRSTPLGDSSDGPELHALTLSDGLILAIGSGPLAEAAFAVVGGTGNYLGATGGYIARQFPGTPGKPGTAEFVVTLLLAEHRTDLALGAAPSTPNTRS
jgi:hypothetical protein